MDARQRMVIDIFENDEIKEEPLKDLVRDTINFNQSKKSHRSDGS